MNNSDFFDIICRNNEEELSDYLLAKGKSPKSICPVIFITTEDSNSETCNSKYNEE